MVKILDDMVNFRITKRDLDGLKDDDLVQFRASGKLIRAPASVFRERFKNSIHWNSERGDHSYSYFPKWLLQYVIKEKVDDVVNQEERAFRAWTKLIECAQGHNEITYRDLAEFLRIHHRPIRYVLDLIQNYCLQNELPPLTILVVNQAGKRGTGFIALNSEEMDEGVRQVQSFKWDALPNPFEYAASGQSLESLTEKLLSRKTTPKETFAIVRVRGTAQILFRNALLTTYRFRCAFCDLGFPDLLEAAHIIPWNKCCDDLKVDIRNGMLLCANHHRLFDAGYLTILNDYIIQYNDPQMTGADYSVSDKAVSGALHGKKISLPSDPEHYPDPILLQRHRNATLCNNASA